MIIIMMMMIMTVVMMKMETWWQLQCKGSNGNENDNYDDCDNDDNCRGSDPSPSSPQTWPPSCLARLPLRSSFYMSGQVIITIIVIIIFNINQSSSMGPPSAPHVWPGRCHRHQHQKHHHPFNMMIIISLSMAISAQHVSGLVLLNK